MRGSERRSTRAVLFSLVLVIAQAGVGCGSRPRAQALVDLAFYENQQAGFRFIRPEGWNIQALAQLPSGRIDKERIVAEFRKTTPDKHAALEISVVDLPSSSGLENYLESRLTGPMGWKKKGGSQKLTLDGVPALRVVYTARVNREDLLREVVAVRRGDRAVFLTGTLPARDLRMREQVRSAVASIVWQ